MVGNDVSGDVIRNYKILCTKNPISFFFKEVIRWVKYPPVLYPFRQEFQ